MKSIGNDIVDLNFINKKRTCQPAFFAKFLSFSEQKNTKMHVSAQIPFEVYVWLLWSAKESVYKFAKRLQPNLIFSPVKICLGSEFSESENFQNLNTPQEFGTSQNPGNSDSAIFLNFTFRDKTYYTLSVITSNYISTIANDGPDFSDFETGIKKIDHSDYNHQSAEVRRIFLERLNLLYPGQAIDISKSEIGYPIIKSSEADNSIIASFAHHGNYVAYAFKVA